MFRQKSTKKIIALVIQTEVIVKYCYSKYDFTFISTPCFFVFYFQNSLPILGQIIKDPENKRFVIFLNTVQENELPCLNFSVQY